MDIEADIQEHRHNLFRISPNSYAKLVHRSLTACQHKFKRFSVSKKFISHIVIGLGSIYLGNNMVQILSAEFLTTASCRKIRWKRW